MAFVAHVITHVYRDAIIERFLSTETMAKSAVLANSCTPMTGIPLVMIDSLVNVHVNFPTSK